MVMVGRRLPQNRGHPVLDTLYILVLNRALDELDLVLKILETEILSFESQEHAFVSFRVLCIQCSSSRLTQLIAIVTVVVYKRQEKRLFSWIPVPILLQRVRLEGITSLHLLLQKRLDTFFLEGCQEVRLVTCDHDRNPFILRKLV